MTKEDILGLFNAIDAFDTQKFASYLDEDDNSTLTVDFSNTFVLNGNKIKDYRIFIDNSELFKQG